MRFPRDLSGKDLAKALKVFGYSITRQTSSHMRLTSLERGEHHITIPQHNSLRVGTFSRSKTFKQWAILARVRLDKDQL